MEADKNTLIERLLCVSYYRLSGYWYPFRQDDTEAPGKKLDAFIPGTSFDTIWARYRFDRKLRFLLLDVIERIEIAFRTKLVFHFTQEHGAFKYADKTLFPKWKEHSKTIRKHEYQSGFKTPSTKGRQNTKRDAFIAHFISKYRNSHLPFWMMAELLDFGSMSRFIEHIDIRLKKKIADDFSLPVEVFLSWLTSLNSLRNACAHHARIWNKVWGTKPKYPSYGRQREWFFVYSEENEEWCDPTQRVINERKKTDFPISCSFGQSHTAILIAICRYLQKRIIPQSSWKTKMENLFEEFSCEDVPLELIGLPRNWKSHPLWIT